MKKIIHKKALPILVSLMCSVLLIQPSVVKAQCTDTLTWNGSANDDWGNPHNWSPADVPNPFLYVRIPDSTNIPNQPKVSASDAICAQLEINTDSGGRLEISGAGNLEVTGGPQTTPVSSQRYDEKTYLVTHNAFTVRSEGWLHSQQDQTIAQQLAGGVRGFMLDVYKYDPVAGTLTSLCDDILKTIRKIDIFGIIPDDACAPIEALIGNQFEDIYFCHGQCNPGVLGVHFVLPYPTFTGSLNEYKTFLNANPNEVLTLFLQDGVRDAGYLDGKINSTGIQNMIYHPYHDPNWKVHEKGWPTLQWMISNNKRLVIFSEHDYNNASSYAAYDKDFMVQNMYGTFSNCAKRDGWSDLGCDKSLFLFNHFGSIPLDQIPLIGTSDIENTKTNIMNRIDNHCCGSATRLPNFIAVDNYHRPFTTDNAVDVVIELNNRWQSQLSGGSFSCSGGSSKAEVEGWNDPASLTSKQASQINVYPNPFSENTTIEFELEEEMTVDIVITDITGKELRVLAADESFPAGIHTVTFNGAGLVNGMYFCRFRAGLHSETRKLLLSN